MPYVFFDHKYTGTLGVVVCSVGWAKSADGVPLCPPRPHVPKHALPAPSIFTTGTVFNTIGVDKKNTPVVDPNDPRNAMSIEETGGGKGGKQAGAGVDSCSVFRLVDYVSLDIRPDDDPAISNRGIYTVANPATIPCHYDVANLSAITSLTPLL